MNQVEKLINDSIENKKLRPALHRINVLFGIKDDEVLGDGLDDGIFCNIIKVHLDTSCSLKSCPNNNGEHFYNCSLYGLPKQEIDKVEELKSLQSINKALGGEIFENLMPPVFVYVENKDQCCFCATRSNLQPLTTKQVVCKHCVQVYPGKFLRLQMEVRYGRNILEILTFVIKRWHSIQEQARVLGISTVQMQELCDIFCLNPRQYKNADESRFVNSFHTRRKSRPVIDGSIYRIYAHYVDIRRENKLRPEIKELNNFLLSQANEFLNIRELTPFNLANADF
jgi:hypothetical protein